MLRQDLVSYEAPLGTFVRASSTPVTDLLDAADRALQEARGDGPGNVSTWVGDLPD